MSVTIRLANPTDAPVLAQFRYDFRTRNRPAEEHEDEESFRERCGRWMALRLGAGGAWRCWIAEREGVTVGHVWVYLVEKIPNPTAESEFHAYLTNFYVLEEARGQGLGTGLLAAALDWCRESAVHAVILWPTERSRPLYLRHGFAVREDLLELIIG